MSETPLFETAIVDQFKVTGYLLSEEHPVGRVKARFFKRHGFKASEWQKFRDALIKQAVSGLMTSSTETNYGKKYIITGRIACPNGQQLQIRTVWFVSVGSSTPRLVTAYRVQGENE